LFSQASFLPNTNLSPLPPFLLRQPQNHDSSFPNQQDSSEDTKDVAAQTLGITLVKVPRWWNGKKERFASLLNFLSSISKLLLTVVISLLAIVSKIRPDLAPAQPEIETSTEPEEQPLTDTRGHIEDIGQPITANFFAQTQINPTNWYSFLPQKNNF